MGVPAEHVATHDDEDHGLGDLDALFIIAHEAAPSERPSGVPPKYWHSIAA